MEEPSSNKPDPMQLLAQAGKSRRRRRPLLVTILFWAVPFALIGFLVWWFWPRPEPTALELAALDEVILPDGHAQLRVHVQAVDSDGRRTNVEGRDVFLVEPKTGLQTKLITGDDGTASVEKSFSADESLVHFLVRIPSAGNRPRLEARGRVFVWPADSSIFVVDGDSSLAEVDSEQIWTTNNAQIKPRKGAVAVLRGIAKKYRIAYMTAEAEHPGRYNKLRAWLEQGWAPQDRFPDGPLLSLVKHYPQSQRSDEKETSK